MDLQMTGKEVENLGYNRHLRVNWRFYKAFFSFFGGMLIGLLFVFLAKTHIGLVATQVIATAMVIAGFIPCVVIIRNAEKAGKKLRAEWEKGK